MILIINLVTLVTCVTLVTWTTKHVFALNTNFLNVNKLKLYLINIKHYIRSRVHGGYISYLYPYTNVTNVTTVTFLEVD